MVLGLLCGCAIGFLVGIGRQRAGNVFGHRAGIRFNSVVRYVGFTEPVAVYVDYDVIQPVIGQLAQGFYAYFIAHPVNPQDQAAVSRLVGEYFS